MPLSGRWRKFQPILIFQLFVRVTPINCVAWMPTFCQNHGLLPMNHVLFVTIHWYHRLFQMLFDCEFPIVAHVLHDWFLDFEFDVVWWLMLQHTGITFVENVGQRQILPLFRWFASVNHIKHCSPEIKMFLFALRASTLKDSTEHVNNHVTDDSDSEIKMKFFQLQLNFSFRVTRFQNCSDRANQRSQTINGIEKIWKFS